MSAPSPSLVSNIRAASRELVRELGFMNRTIAGTDLSPSAVHTILEIGAAGHLSAKALSEKLLLEKSSVSRLIKSLIKKGDVGEAPSKPDGRVKNLFLTTQGKRTLRSINHYATSQVVAATSQLDTLSQQDLANSLHRYADALRKSRDPDSTSSLPEITIDEGYRPGILGDIVQLHMACYSDWLGFGVDFECRVGGDIAEFLPRLQSPANTIWTAQCNGNVIGSIAIDGEDLGNNIAHLRWFILADGYRGSGFGNALFQSTLAFCDENRFDEIHLWTVDGLAAARRLYESNGFELAEEYPGTQWGKEMLEQKFVRQRSAALDKSLFVNRLRNHQTLKNDT